jgi:hypothetical protein
VSWLQPTPRLARFFYSGNDDTRGYGSSVPPGFRAGFPSFGFFDAGEHGTTTRSRRRTSPTSTTSALSELGPLLLKVQHAVLAVPGVGNLHAGRRTLGEASEHCHIWFMARPARMEQFRSSFAAIWDDVLPPLPEETWRANLEIVRQTLNSLRVGAETVGNTVAQHVSKHENPRNHAGFRD